MRRFLNFVTGDATPTDSLDDFPLSGVQHDRDSLSSPMNQPRSPLNDTMVATHVIDPGREPQMNPSLSAMLRLRAIVAVLRGYADETITEYALVLGALKELAETMVWADQHDPNVWDLFLEFAVMPLLVRCLRVTVSAPSPAPRADAQIPANSTPDASLSNGHASPHPQPQHSEQAPGSHHSAEELPPSNATGERINGTAAPPSERRGSDPASSLIWTDPADILARESLAKAPSRAMSALSLSASIVDDLPASPVVDDAKRPPSADPHVDVMNRQVEIQAQILQTISIVIQSVSRQQSLLCLFSANHINDILSFEYAFENEEVLAFFMSAVKSIALKLDEGLLQLFFDPVRRSFPLYSAVVRFLDHPEAMVRIAVRNVTLTIYALGDSEVLQVAAKDEALYFKKTVDLLAKLCGSVALAFEFLLDDGREVRRTRSRTGLFRRRVKISEVTAKLEEIENICAYLGDVSTVSQSYLHPHIVNLVSSRLFSPFFRPIASLASPAALRAQGKWRISRAESESETKPALPLFDAAARCLVLACLLTHCKSSPLGSVLVRDLCRPTSEFEGRHVLNGLKAMATDVTGTERASFVALCAIEAFINCQAASKQLLGSLKYDFYYDDTHDIAADGSYGGSKPFINIGIPDEDDLQRRGSEQLLMTLSEFEAPLTPTTSLPGTPTLHTAGSLDGMKTPPNGFRDSRVSSFDSNLALSLSPHSSSNPSLERTDSDGVLSAFQLGETSLREAISSVVLVVRRREVRTMRVLQAIARIIGAVEKRTNDTNSCVDVTKIVLDELAEVVSSLMKSKRTTIVSIEKMFDNFKKAAVSKGVHMERTMTLETILSPDRLPLVASEYPRGAGKRRRVHAEDPTPPLEAEDAYAFMLMVSMYDETLVWANALEKFGSLRKQVEDILTEDGVEDSYLEKRYALEDISKAVLEHGVV
eukprot:GFKZ01007624.1.p1 GENE.GFKZ01007624.1~~GFKZ01007624.1.p1  ORF type:complete len:935 (+),score=145.65 GFKZ01007624.1:443-3247(+)